VVTIDHAAGGMRAEGSTPKGFTIAGEDKKFFFADAVIDGDKVTVSSHSVPNPSAVRYAWADMPEVNVVNGKGLPLSPFRTDEWPLPESGGYTGSQPIPTSPVPSHP